ncbi:hypothetical protein EPA93_38845 [Ktedonosporobacter rubrisoli]|uniref:Uncharacterized protein n=1 Tax=Ktedonosporobacter rubrisoli TaxID=2509675 RepID=A0A4P6K0W4_KTERU|nr:hypothetical protein [Ktedonosporobacter rubrisoli]QBD81615.1 hypothetical protein EPA93_38845 [Ktedonosporobacter rubrisoli]
MNEEMELVLWALNATFRLGNTTQDIPMMKGSFALFDACLAYLKLQQVTIIYAEEKDLYVFVDPQTGEEVSSPMIRPEPCA